MSPPMFLFKIYIAACIALLILHWFSHNSKNKTVIYGKLLLKTPLLIPLIFFGLYFFNRDEIVNMLNGGAVIDPHPTNEDYISQILLASVIFMIIGMSVNYAFYFIVNKITKI
jgi:hypothetical protein